MGCSGFLFSFLAVMIDRSAPEPPEQGALASNSKDINRLDEIA